MRLRLGRCRITVSFWFFSLLALAAACGGKYMLAGIIAAAVHECGHIAAAAMCAGRDTPVYFDITPAGFRMGVIPAGLDGRRELLILSAGVTANLLAAAPLLLAGAGGHAAAQLCIAAVNAAPVSPLDGGRVLRLLLSRKLDEDRAEKAVSAISLAALFPMALAGFFVLLRSRGNVSLLVMTGWLLWKVVRS